MSKGIGAVAIKVLEDDKTIIYRYGAYNLDRPEYRNRNHVYDGAILIQRDCFAEPEIHEKLKKLPSGRKKLITKRVPVSVEYGRMLQDGEIVVENCSNCWQTTNDVLCVDVMALHLLFYIFLRYQEEGSIPEKITYDV